ncbi:putative RNA recognition motif domain, nucleotide-binding alpha-beta plait domain superfamily [Helianthus annuus]|nr:putative RNA recognition motif domain, nucleotide-binding alpha-beta plait domain superfamily [Helianthus annuus]
MEYQKYKNPQEEEWRVAKYKGKRLVDGNVASRRPVMIETTFYVGNLPEDCSSYLLWDVFRNFGNMSDAYVPRKKDKKGNTFGFLRFKGVRDAQTMAANLGSARIDHRKLFVTPAKFVKDPGNQSNKLPKVKQTRLQSVVVDKRDTDIVTKEPVHAKAGRSYAEVITGIKHTNTPETDLNIVCVESESSKRWRDNLLIAVLKNPYDLKDFQQLLSEDGLNGFIPRYMGGLSLLLSFANQSEAVAFLDQKKDNWEKWFSVLHRWDGRFIPYQRLAKLVIRGVPIQFWGREIFDQIGGLLGSVILPSTANDDDLDLSVNSVGIITDKVARINCKLTIAWHGHPYEILISEDISAGFPFAPTTGGGDATGGNVEEVEKTASSSASKEVGRAISNTGTSNPNVGKHGMSFNGKSSFQNMAAATNSYVGTTPVNSNEGSHEVNDTDVSLLGPFDTPPPPPKEKPIDIWARNSAVGLNTLFNEAVEETPPDRPIGEAHINESCLSPDPFNLRELLNQVREKKAGIDLNNPPNISDDTSNHPAPPVNHSGIQRKVKIKFPSMKMKDTLWGSKSVEVSKSKHKVTAAKSAAKGDPPNNSNPGVDPSEIDKEASITKEVADGLGFMMNIDEIRNQIQAEQASTVPQ